MDKESDSSSEGCEFESGQVRSLYLVLLPPRGNWVPVGSLKPLGKFEFCAHSWRLAEGLAPLWPSGFSGLEKTTTSK